ncbi:unnamed protein product [Ostreobium quekettii]|uniref:Uncharacterized protein n=1 Tax=Ostreobium quekettii TaxID=121088 RepID=A0A8S1IM65_9CHLO|nr:unnamed protein product [Ostreobium quekettii]
MPDLGDDSLLVEARQRRRDDGEDGECPAGKRRRLGVDLPGKLGGAERELEWSGESGGAKMGPPGAVRGACGRLQAVLDAENGENGGKGDGQGDGVDAMLPMGRPISESRKLEGKSVNRARGNGLGNEARQFGLAPAGIVVPGSASMQMVGALPGTEGGIGGFGEGHSVRLLPQLQGASPRGEEARGVSQPGGSCGPGAPIELAKTCHVKDLAAGGEGAGCVPRSGAAVAGGLGQERPEKLLGSMQDFASFVQQTCLMASSQGAHQGARMLASGGACHQAPQNQAAQPLPAAAAMDTLALPGVMPPGVHSMTDMLQKQVPAMPPRMPPKSETCTSAFLPQPSVPLGMSTLMLPPVLAQSATGPANMGAPPLPPNMAIQRCQDGVVAGLGSMGLASLPSECYSVPAAKLQQGTQTPLLLDTTSMLTLLGQQQTGDATISACETQQASMQTSRAGAPSVQNLSLSAGLGLGPQGHTVPGLMQVPLLLGQQVCQPTQGMDVVTVVNKAAVPVQPGAGMGVVHDQRLAQAGEVGLAANGQQCTASGQALVPDVPLRPQAPLGKNTVRGLLHVFSDDMRFIFFNSQQAMFGESAWVPGQFHYTELSECEKHGSPMAQRFFVELINRIRGC